MTGIRRHVCLLHLLNSFKKPILLHLLHEHCSVLGFSYTVYNGYVISHFLKQLVSGFLDVTQRVL
jgi:hypothetical protein